MSTEKVETASQQVEPSVVEDPEPTVPGTPINGDDVEKKSTISDVVSTSEDESDCQSVGHSSVSPQILFVVFKLLMSDSRPLPPVERALRTAGSSVNWTDANQSSRPPRSRPRGLVDSS